ncbi:hypothetical protein Nmel_000707, partial [Mimus melanotis]
ALPAFLSLPGHLPSCPLGNSLIISAIACSHHLHTPMFFFLLNLALTDQFHLHHCPQSHAQFPLDHVLHRMCCTGVFLH